MYLITCPCGLQYVGMTTRKIKLRISEHRSTIRCHKMSTKLMTHFWIRIIQLMLNGWYLKPWYQEMTLREDSLKGNRDGCSASLHMYLAWMIISLGANLWNINTYHLAISIFSHGGILMIMTFVDLYSWLWANRYTLYPHSSVWGLLEGGLFFPPPFFLHFVD